MSEEVKDTADVSFKEFTVEDVQKQLKPLSQNGFVRFFQKIWRWWLGTWYGFCDKHPKLSNLLQMAFFFIIFSEGVTILQFIIMTFLPYAFQSMWETPFVVPAVPIAGLVDATGNQLNYALFNEPVSYLMNVFNVAKDGEAAKWIVDTAFAYDQAGVAQYTGSYYYDADVLNSLLANSEFIAKYGYDLTVANGGFDNALAFAEDLMRNALADPELSGLTQGATLESYQITALQMSGLGNFIAFEIAVFLAQCINFPLQRNITYRSHGNPWIQGMWYFIGWLAVSVATNAIWGIMNPLLLSWQWPQVVIGLVKTVLTGGVSLVVFFFIFMVIFPDNNKMAKKSKAKYEKLVAKNAPTEKVVKAENKMKLWEDKATKSNAEKEYFKAKSQVSSAVMKYNAIVKASEKPNLKEEVKATYPEKIEKAFENAVSAIKTKDEKELAFNEAKAL